MRILFAKTFAAGAEERHAVRVQQLRFQARRGFQVASQKQNVFENLKVINETSVQLSAKFKIVRQFLSNLWCFSRYYRTISATEILGCGGQSKTFATQYACNAQIDTAPFSDFHYKHSCHFNFEFTI